MTRYATSLRTDSNPSCARIDSNQCLTAVRRFNLQSKVSNVFLFGKSGGPDTALVVSSSGLLAKKQVEELEMRQPTVYQRAQGQHRDRYPRSVFSGFESG